MSVWNELFKQEAYRWKNPHEKVVELATQLQADGRPLLVCDLGCGAGRHLVYLQGLGFKTAGLDSAMRGLRHARNWLQEQSLPAWLGCADMTCLPCASDRFDILIAMHVIHHNRLAEIRTTIEEIYRVLKPGGRALVTFPSTRSSRYGQGELIEPGTYIPDSGDDIGLPHHYVDLVELAFELRRFIVSKVELLESQSSRGELHSHWVVLFEKPSQQ